MSCFPCFKRKGKEKYTLAENRDIPSKTPQKSQVTQPVEPDSEERPVPETVVSPVESKQEETPVELEPAAKPAEPVAKPVEPEPVAKPAEPEPLAKPAEPVQASVEEETVQRSQTVTVEAAPPALPAQVAFDFPEIPDDINNQEAFELALSTLAKLYEINPKDLTPEMSQGMEKLVARLEKVADRLEACSHGGGGAGGAGGDDALPVFVEEYDNFLNGEVAEFLKGAAAIGGKTNEICVDVDRAFKLQRSMLVTAAKSQKPKDADLPEFLKPLREVIMKIQDFREKNRTDKQFNHLSAISEAIPALGWVAVSPAPAPYVRQMEESSQFYTNKILKEFRESDPKQANWAKSLIKLLKDLAAYVKAHHTTGLTWNPRAAPYVKGGVSAAPPPPGAPAPPPPPPVLPPTGAPAPKASGDDAARAALFSDLNKGTNVTKGLKKVTDDMKTHKNPALRATGPTPNKKPSTSPKPAPAKPAASGPVKGPPVLALEGKKWKVENQDNQQNLIITTAETNHTVYVYKCTNSVLKITSKVNSITLDNCKKMALVFEGVISCVEFVNCRSVKVQVTGKCSLFSVDKTDGCQIFLSKDSIDAEIVSAKSSEMNVMIPKDDGDYDEYPLPEQYKSTFTGKGFKTECTESI